MEEKEETTQRMISLYCDIEKFLTSDDFKEDLRNELHESYPKYLHTLDQMKKDIRRDQGIVIAGKNAIYFSLSYTFM